MKSKILGTIFLVCAFLISYHVSAQQKQQPQQAPKKASYKFDVMEHDFGDVKEASGPLTFKYEFTNTGKEAFKLKKVEPSCSCIALEYTTDLVKPGAKGFIKASFDIRQRKGIQTKRVYVVINEGEQVDLLIKTNIVN